MEDLLSVLAPLVGLVPHDWLGAIDSLCALVFVVAGALSPVSALLAKILGTPKPGVDSKLKTAAFKITIFLQALSINVRKITDSALIADLRHRLGEYEKSRLKQAELIADKNKVIASQDAHIERQASNLVQLQKLVPREPDNDNGSEPTVVLTTFKKPPTDGGAS